MYAAEIAGCFSIDIATEFVPAGAVPFVDARMARICAIAIVGVGTDGKEAAIAGEGNALAAVIINGFSIDVATALIPGGAVPFVNARMARICAIAIV